MLLTKLLLRLWQGNSVPAFQLFHALTYCGQGLSTLQPVEQRLIAAGILDNEFSTAIDG